MNMFKSNGGFTLVELIVVIAILAILAGAAIPAYSGYIARANDSTVLAELEAVETAAFAAAALKGETPVKIVINAAAIDATDDAAAVAAGTVKVFVKDADGKAEGDDKDATYDELDITEFYKGTVDLSKHSVYSVSGKAVWYAVDKGEITVDNKPVKIVKGWNGHENG